MKNEKCWETFRFYNLLACGCFANSCKYFQNFRKIFIETFVFSLRQILAQGPQCPR